MTSGIRKAENVESVENETKGRPPQERTGARNDAAIAARYLSTL